MNNDETSTLTHQNDTRSGETGADGEQQGLGNRGEAGNGNDEAMDDASGLAEGIQNDTRVGGEQESGSDREVANDDAMVDASGLNEGDDPGREDDAGAGGGAEAFGDDELGRDDEADDVGNGAPDPLSELRRSLRQNTIQELRLILDPTHSNDLSLTRALRSNVSVTTIKISVHPDGFPEAFQDPSLLDRPEHANLKSYLMAALSLPNLKKLRFLPQPRRCNIAAPSFVLQHAPGLQDVLLGFSTLTGTALEFQQFADLLQGMNSLQDLELWHAPFPIAQTVNAQEIQEQLTPITSAISRLPNLKMLALDGVRMNSANFGRFIRNPSLELFIMTGVPLDEGRVSSIAERLRMTGPSSNLKSIVLRDFGLNQLTPEVTAAISGLITGNLPLLDLRLLGVIKQEEASSGRFLEFFEAVTQALSSNSTLKSFEMSASSRRMDLPIEVSNKSLERFNEMLEVNTNLIRVVLQGFVDESGAPRTDNAKGDLYVKLNRWGRGLFLNGNFGKAHWIERLLEFSEDLDCLFYFLSANPSLCQVDFEAGQHCCTTKKRKRDS